MHASPSATRSPGNFTDRSTPSSIRYPSGGRPSSRTRSTQSNRHGPGSPMLESPDRSPSRGRDSGNFRKREHSSPSTNLKKGHKDADSEAVCNYDTNVTTLYELLESSNWEKAKARCRSHPHEVRTWIVRRDAISQKVRWKLLPLHAAVIFQSPTFVVSALIENYPAAVSRRDDQGMLPLHLAFRYKEDNEDLLELLLMQCPKGVLMKDKRDRTPLEHGRGTKFSAKLMRLYAEAAVSGSRSLTMGGSFDNLNIKGGETNEKLNSIYEDRIRTLQEENNAALNQLRRTTDEEKKRLINCHMEEMEAMRSMINSSAGGDAQVIADLESEMNQLRTALTDAKAERDSANLYVHELKTFTDNLTIQLRQFVQDQESLQLMVFQQQQELEKCQTRREQLIQNLLRQEQEEKPSRTRRGTEIKELISSGRTAMQSLLAREPDNRPSVEHQHLDRQQHQNEHYYSQRQKVTANDVTPAAHEKSPAYYTGVPSTTAIKDDISAITENSHF